MIDDFTQYRDCTVDDGLLFAENVGKYVQLSEFNVLIRHDVSSPVSGNGPKHLIALEQCELLSSRRPASTQCIERLTEYFPNLEFQNDG